MSTESTESTGQTVPPARDGTLSADRYLAVSRSPEFTQLRKLHRSFVFPMTVVFFVWYLLYVLLSAYGRGFMDTQVVGNLNIAFFFGILQFVSTFLIAWLYSRYANRRLDPESARIKAELEGGTR